MTDASLLSTCCCPMFESCSCPAMVIVPLKKYDLNNNQTQMIESNCDWEETLFDVNDLSAIANSRNRTYSDIPETNAQHLRAIKNSYDSYIPHVVSQEVDCN